MDADETIASKDHASLRRQLAGYAHQPADLLIRLQKTGLSHYIDGVRRVAKLLKSSAPDPAETSVIDFE